MSVKKIKIQKIGSLLDVDQNGFIIKRAATDKIQPKWLLAVEAVITVYKKHFGTNLHSVYVRGSVTVGEAIDGVSDVDTIAIIRLPVEKIDLDLVQALNQKFAERFPFVNGVEIVVKPLTQLDKGNKIMLKTQAVCVYGQDISDTLPSLKPGKDTVQHVFSLGREIENTKNFLQKGNTTSAQVQQRCTWIMKRILRVGCELVMERSLSYTRDLYPCYELFARYYPEKENAMKHVLELAVNPIADHQEILKTLDNFGSWIRAEIKSVFSEDFLKQ